MSPSQKNGAQTTSRALRRADGGSRPARVQPRRPEGPKSSIIALKASYYSIRFGSHAHVISPLTAKRGCAGVDRRRVFFRISLSVYLFIYLSISLSIYIYIYIYIYIFFFFFCFLLLKQPEGHSHPLSRSYCVSQCILCYVTLLRVRMTNGEHARLALRILQAGAASGVCMVISTLARLALDDLSELQLRCLLLRLCCLAVLYRFPVFVLDAAVDELQHGREAVYCCDWPQIKGTAEHQHHCQVACRFGIHYGALWFDDRTDVHWLGFTSHL